MILDLILGSFGISTIDENLTGLIDAMKHFPADSLNSELQSWAKIIGLGIALGVGSYECYMMVLGRRGIDVMKLLRIVIISLCITFSSYICEAARAPGDGLQELTREWAMAENENVSMLESQISDQQKLYLAALKNVKIKLDEQKEADQKTFWQSVVDGEVDEYISDKIDAVKDNAKNWMMGAALTAETTVTQWINAIVRFICELLFQVSYYGLLVAENLFLIILTAFCPIAFALSLAPPFQSAWSQWLSKFVSISLWGFVIYMVLYNTFFIMEYSLEIDLKAYQALTKNVEENMSQLNWQEVGQIGMQSLGTTVMYVIGLLVGVFLLKFVPEVASWLIPGGASSGAGSAVGSAVGGATGAVAPVTNMSSSVTGAPTRYATAKVDKFMGLGPGKGGLKS